MIAWLDTSPTGFIVVTVFLAGGASCLTGQALASTWRPARQIVLYTAMLGLADRFLNFALFEGALLSLSGYLIDTALLLVVAFVIYRLTLARKMVSQYPWLYERTGLFGWREKVRA